MLFFGHIGITAFLGTLLYLPSLIAVFGVMLPDIVDKGLFVLGISEYSRLFAHNMFFGPAVGLVAYLITRRKDLAIAILFGTYMHLIQDMRDLVPLFWPFVEYDLVPVAEIKVVLDIYTIVTEAIGISLLATLFLFRQNVLYLRKKLFKKYNDFYGKRTSGKI